MGVELQAYLDGELSPEEAGAVEARLATDDSLRRKLQVLKAVKEALEEAAPEDSVLPAEVEARLVQQITGAAAFDEAPVRPRSISLWIKASLAAAAVLLFLVIFFNREKNPQGEREHEAKMQQGPQEEPIRKDEAENAFLRLCVIKEKKAAVLLHDVIITLEVEARKEPILLYLVPNKPGVSLEDLAEEMVTKDILVPPKAGFLPCTLSARIFTPGGETLEARVDYPPSKTLAPLSLSWPKGSLKAPRFSWTLPLSCIHVFRKAPRTYWDVAPKMGGGWIADQVKAYEHFQPIVTRANEKSRPDHWERFAPVETGTYRMEIVLRTLPARKEYAWPVFEEPLQVGIPFEVSGHVGAWSKEVKGLRFRLAMPESRCRKGEVFPILLQIRNTGSLMKRYNITRLAGNPSMVPYQFDFILDEKGRPADFIGSRPAEKGFSFTLHGTDLFVPHLPGVLRTIVVPSRWWFRDGKPLDEISGPARLGCRFQFQPTSWPAEDRTYWMGKVDVPPIDYRVEE